MACHSRTLHKEADAMYSAIVGGEDEAVTDEEWMADHLRTLAASFVADLDGDGLATSNTTTTLQRRVRWMAERIGEIRTTLPHDMTKRCADGLESLRWLDVLESATDEFVADLGEASASDADKMRTAPVTQRHAQSHTVKRPTDKRLTEDNQLGLALDAID